uniref:GDSL esterase/lipase n=1 Tax=Physcomitrium patens TaxID=3218 RepID=A0A2K1KNP8_PHYPA|nr:hypothetical protein PHYPA_006302 [Physcomitrium patens]
MERRSVLWYVLVVTCCLHTIAFKGVDSATVCEYPAVYSFGDSLVDNGNSIAAFPVQFAYAEANPNGALWASHAADRMCDGTLLVDFFSFGSSLGPSYPFLRSTATMPQFGSNFGAAGATAVNQTSEWIPNSGFNTPFSLNYQLQWLRRYKVRLDYYYQQSYVNQSLPSVASLNSSLYIVQAGFQDYFFSLYEQKSTTRRLLTKVDSVVSAIGDLLKGLAQFGGANVVVVNLPPLGCFPALLTIYPASVDKYDKYGCLSSLNKISTAHNTALNSTVLTIREKYRNVTFHYGDLFSAYTDILKSPQTYNITQPLKACCGAGGS